jgi:hypothetical protein
LVKDRKRNERGSSFFLFLGAEGFGDEAVGSGVCMGKIGNGMREIEQGTKDGGWTSGKVGDEEDDG